MTALGLKINGEMSLKSVSGGCSADAPTLDSHVFSHMCVDPRIWESSQVNAFVRKTASCFEGGNAGARV